MRAILRKFWAIIAISFVLSSCSKTPLQFDGYVEGEFVYISSALSGQLERLDVSRGDTVKSRATLYSLDSKQEAAQLSEARERLAQARAIFADLKKGVRPSELEGLQAQLRQAESRAALSKKVFLRTKKLLESKAVSQQAYDEERSANDQALQQVDQLQQAIQTAKLGAREDQVRAAEEEIKAREYAVKSAEWAVMQKERAAGQDSFVFDTLYRPGEFVAAGKPVVILLPPENIRIRTFVPEAEMTKIKIGDAAAIINDGHKLAAAKVSYISPQNEYTPPVVYSQASRTKLVYLVELSLDPAATTNLHPGQPITVKFE